jgi:hypothetical protein
VKRAVSTFGNERYEPETHELATRDADGVMQLFAPGADVVMVTSEESFARPWTSPRAAGIVAARTVSAVPSPV